MSANVSTVESAVCPVGVTASRTLVADFADWLTALGCRQAFGFPGRQIDPLLSALHQQSGCRLVIARHELCAAYMALGAARLSCGPSMVAAIGAPGAQLMLAAARTAVKDRTPVVFVTGAEAADEEDAFQFASCDEAAFQAVGLRSLVLTTDNFQSVRNAIVESVDQCRPIHVQVDLDNQVAAVAPASSPARYQSPETRELLPRPTLLLVADSNLAPFAPALRAFARFHGWRTATTLLARGLFDEDDPNHVGYVGLASRPEVLAALVATEQVICLGAHACQWSDIVGRSMQDRLTPPVFVQARRWLLWQDWLRRHPSSADAQPNSRRLRPRAANDAWSAPLLRRSAQVLFAAIWQAIPVDASLVVDAGELRRAACALGQPSDPRELILCEREAPMGFALSAAIGACCVGNGRAVVALMGDGSFLMHATELVTAVVERLPLLVIVHQNGCLASPSIRAEEPNWRACCAVPEIDFCSMAAGMGVHAQALREPAGLAQAIAAAMAWTQRHQQPYLLVVQWQLS